MYFYIYFRKKKQNFRQNIAYPHHFSRSETLNACFSAQDCRPVFFFKIQGNTLLSVDRILPTQCFLWRGNILRIRIKSRRKYVATGMKYFETIKTIHIYQSHIYCIWSSSTFVCGDYV